MMAKPKEDDNGSQTLALIDLLNPNQQVSIVQKATTGPMLLETARTIIQVMIEFQGIERDTGGPRGRGGSGGGSGSRVRTSRPMICP